MFRGNYNFFDYKYNISGYTGQDYGSIAQKIYLISSFVLIILLLFFLRKLSKEKILKIIKITGIFMTTLYICKTVWESIYDIKLSGSFNTGLLPLDTCSIIMYACLLAGFGKGKIKKMAECWLTTGAIVGGFATMLYLNAFKYYPFFSFGAFYSMIWHFLMVSIGLLLIVNDYVELKYESLLQGYLFHLIFSIVIIPIDFIFNFDFMLYHDLGGIPIFEDIATKCTQMNLSFLNPLLMLLLYFIAFNIIYFGAFWIRKIFKIKKYNTIKKEGKSVS